MIEKTISSIPQKVLNVMPKSKILRTGKVALFQGFYYYKLNGQWIRDYKA